MQKPRTSLLSALLTLSFVLPATAAVPTKVHERTLEVLLPGVLDDADEPPDELEAPVVDGQEEAGADEDGEGEEDTFGEVEGEGESEDEEGAADDEAPPPRPSKTSRTSKSGASKSSTSSKSSKQASATKKPSKQKPLERPKGAKECEYRTPLYEHEVAKGENLGAIAGRYGVRRDDLIRLNQIKNPNLIRPGQRLKVCPEIAPRTRKEVEHVVAKGENPTKIAERYGMTANELIALQKGKLGERLKANPRALRIGDHLTVMVEVEAKPELAPAAEERGVLRASVQLAGGAHYHVKRPHLAYGTDKTIRAIKSAISRYKQRKPKGPKVHVGDISRQGGGPLKGHRSHQRGVDVDIGLVHKGILAGEKKFVDANPQTLDIARTWALIKAFTDTREVRAIFLDYGVQKILYDYARKSGVSQDTLDELFQYPRGKGHAHGIIRHWKGHRNHFHVRFRG
ncbi:MAG: penicillin-insensitive murein endopeptidase [Myxococcales bacterium]|nr:penicillin-insensitive murein endopeptidase [Myxococcales bacterium]